jgi:hypothetical protein
VVVAADSDADMCPAGTPVAQRHTAHITVGDVPLKLSLAAAQTVYGSFAAVAGTTYNIQVLLLDVAAVKLTLFGTDGLTTLQSTTTGSDGSPALHMLWTCPGGGDGMYQLALQALSLTDAGTVSLSVMAEAAGPCDEGGLKLTASSGAINYVHPDHAPNYADNQHCTWDIVCPPTPSSPNGGRVSLQFNLFETEKDHDEVFLFSAPPGSESVLDWHKITTLSGLVQTNRPYQSSTSHMVVDFQSDSNGKTGAGFQADYTCVGAGRSYSSMTVDEGYVQAAISPSKKQQWFSFAVDSQYSYTISIKMHSLLSAKLFVYKEDGITQIAETETETLEVTPSSSTLSSSSDSQEPGVLRVMVAPGDPSQTGSFGIAVTKTPSACGAQQRNIDAHNAAGTISFLGHDYTDNEDCSWHIDCAIGERVHLQVSMLDTESHGDFVDIVDIGELSEYRDVLASLSGSLNAKILAGTQQQDFMTRENHGLITFHSDQSTTGSGFRIGYSCCSAAPESDAAACAPVSTLIAREKHAQDNPVHALPTQGPAHKERQSWELITVRSGVSVGHVVPVTATTLRQFFSFAAIKQSTYTISVSLSGLTGADLVFYDTDGSTQLDSVFVTAGGGENSITWTCTTVGIYKVMVTALLAADTDNGSFTLSIAEEQPAGSGSAESPTFSDVLHDNSCLASSGDIGIVKSVKSDGQRHAVDFGSVQSKASEVCMWTFLCDDPDSTVLIEFTRFRSNHAAHLHVYGDALSTLQAQQIRMIDSGHPDIPNMSLNDLSGLHNMADLDTDVFEGSADLSQQPQQIVTESNEATLLFTTLKSESYRGFTAKYQCLSPGQSTFAPATAHAPTVGTFCAQLQVGLKDTCCNRGQAWTHCFAGLEQDKPACSQTCAQSFVPFANQCQNFIDKQHMDQLLTFTQLRTACTAEIRATLPPPRTVLPAEPREPAPGEVLVTFDVTLPEVDSTSVPGPGANPPQPTVVGQGDVVTVQGDFNSWCGECDNVLIPMDNNRYRLQLSLPPGSYKYVYTINGWNGDIEDLPGGSCDVGLPGPRMIDVGTLQGRKVTHEVVTDHWGSCESERLEPPPTLPSLPPSPSVPAVRCVCKHDWNYGNTDYHDCASVKRGATIMRMCYVQGDCNGVHEGAWGRIEGNLWMECNEDNVNKTPVEPHEHNLPADIRESTTNAHGIVTTVATDGVDGYTTFRLTLSLSAESRNVYTIFGESDNRMTFPPAFQAGAPVGVDIGGTVEAFWQIDATAQYDSWLTVGVDDGNQDGQISSIGIVWTDWSLTGGITVDDGAVFWMDPDNAPGGASLVAQLTMPTSQLWTATVGAQGRSKHGVDWQERGIQFRSTVAAHDGH